MTEAEDSTPAQQTSCLVTRRLIRAPAEQLFDAWIRPDLLVQWWGPQGVVCTHAEMDVQVGGRYRIDNRLPNGELVVIFGEYERIARPHELVFSWRLDPVPRDGSNVSERVIVQFEPRGNATLVTVTHERIPNDAIRKDHEHGWEGCLDGLARFLT